MRIAKGIDEIVLVAETPLEYETLIRLDADYYQIELNDAEKMEFVIREFDPSGDE